MDIPLKLTEMTRELMEDKESLKTISINKETITSGEYNIIWLDNIIEGDFRTFGKNINYALYEETIKKGK